MVGNVSLDPLTQVVEDGNMTELSLWEKLKRRKLRNYLFLDKRLQFHFALLLAAIGAINAFYFSILVYFYTQEIYRRLIPQIPEYILNSSDFDSQYRIYLITVIFISLFEIVMILLLGLFFSHRIAGPLYAMRMKLRDIALGSVPSPVHLRKNDLLIPFGDQLNEAISVLQENRASVEKALVEIRAGRTRECEACLRAITEKATEPGLSSPHGAPPSG
jgi:hypothetical protein